MADRGATWRDVEVKALLEVWSGELIQAQLSGAYRNETVFQTISDMLERRGIHRTGRQCRDKIKSLKKKCKEIADKLRRSGVGVDSDEELEVWHDWKWFEPLHRLMRKRPSVNPVGLLEIGRRSRPDTPASIGSDTSGALLDQSVLSGDDGQRVNTTDHGSSTTTTASTSATAPESSTTSTASASATAPESSATTSASASATTLESSTTSTPSASTTVPGSSTATTTASASATVLESSTTTTSLAGSSILPAVKRKRKQTKMERAQRDVNATFDKLLKQQEDTKESLLQIMKESMKTDREARREEKEQTTAFLSLLSNVVTMLRPPPAAPGPSHWPGYYMPPAPDIPPASATSPPWPPSYGVPLPAAPHVPPPDHESSDDDDN